MDYDISRFMIRQMLNLNISPKQKLNIIGQYQYDNKIFDYNSLFFNRILLEVINERDDLELMLIYLDLFKKKYKYKYILIINNLAHAPKIKNYIKNNYCNDCLNELEDVYYLYQNGNSSYKFCDDLCCKMFFL